MKKLLLVLFIISMFTSPLGFAKPGNSESLDNIVAVVNDDVITQSELDHAMALIKTQLASENVSAPPPDVLRKQILDQLVNKKLQLQLAKGHIQITDADINKVVEKIAGQNNISAQELYEHLIQTGMTKAEYRKEIHDQLILQKLQQQEVIGHINIAPTEVDKLMRTSNWQTSTNKEYRLEDILVPFSEAPSVEEIMEAKKHAEGVMMKLKRGQSVDDVIKTDPGLTTPLQGGDLGWRKLAEVPSVFASYVARMSRNQIFGPIQAANGFHVIKLIDVRNATGKPDRKEAEEVLMQRKYEQAMQVWLSKLRSQAFIVTNPEK